MSEQGQSISRPLRAPTKYVFVTGGVASALGKGITAASLGRLLKARGLSVTMQKLDPYLNVDPGTMNPFEHGEVFVTDDGGETDLDLGHYERFVDVSLGRGSSVSSGQVWSSVIAKERRGDYLGKTVQVIPHVTNEIKHRIEQVGRSLAGDDGGRPVDVVIVEVGGTVGDIEGLPFLEAIRQFRYDVGRNNLCYVHCALVPYISAAGELKTKPAQHSVRELRSIGIQPDVVVLRADRELDEGLKRKVAMLCDVDTDAVVGAVDQASLYEVPLAMRAEGLDEVVTRRLSLPPAVPDLTEWEELVQRVQSLRDRVRIGVVGKYVELPDAYLSVAEALRHAGFAHGVDVDVEWIASDDLDADNAWARLRTCDGIIVPGGFGVRGIEGKVEAVRLAREHDVPFLGICLGLQVACIEFARNVAGLTFASSSEFDPNAPDLVIDLMADQVEVEDKGGTMRLGAYPARLVEGTATRAAYGQEVVYERHRHRFEFANAYREVFREAGMTFSGLSPDGRLVEFIELTSHPWFVATQAHPELKSRPNRPHPLFSGFVEAAKERAGQLQGRLPSFDVVGMLAADRVDPIDEPTAAEVREALSIPEIGR